MASGRPIKRGMSGDGLGLLAFSTAGSCNIPQSLDDERLALKLRINLAGLRFSNFKLDRTESALDHWLFYP
jgi:hypothetical protein